LHGSQYADNAKDADGNAKKGKKGSQFVFPQFQQGHFETAADDF
jgi:hypothetical protein